ncbi:MAG: VOC family protein [Propionibacteriaceae bacterium]|nr:VOC family protein [Propionibacteriaceae bacterium]
MHIDHVVYAAGPIGLRAEADRFEDLLGVKSIDGGLHPRFGTRMRLIPMADARYIEIVEVLDHPAADKAPYGQAVRARSELGGGWLGWVVSVEDLTELEQRLQRKSTRGTRHFPDGRALEWDQVGIKGLIADPQLPYFISWVSEPSVLPSALPAEVRLLELDIAGSRQRVEQWLGVSVDDVSVTVSLKFESPSGYPGVIAVTVDSPKGKVRI